MHLNDIKVKSINNALYCDNERLRKEKTKMK